MRGRRNSIVDLASGLRDERPMIRGSISCRRKRWPLSLFQNLQCASGAFPGSYTVVLERAAET
jgi:hypothetical protein